MEYRVVSDRNFDDLADRLKKRVYGSPKGRLRVELVWEDISRNLSERMSKKPLRILDAGGGFGQISLKLAGEGHSVVLCDISEKMLDGAVEQFESRGLRDRLTIIHSPFQSLPENHVGSYDLVMSHAVMEWLIEPELSLERLINYLKPGGMISLMFYNRHSLVYQNAIKGNFRKVMAEEFSGDPNGLTPVNPLTPEDVEGWLRNGGIDSHTKTGIRVFYDYIPRPIRRERKFDDIMALEKSHCRTEPFVSLGRYIHIMGTLNP